MKKELNVINGITRADFDSLSDFIQFVESNIGKGVEKYSEHKEDDGEWYGSKNINEAIELARHGWDKGIGLISKMMEDVSAKGFEKSLKPRFDVYGDSVDMGRFMSGEPECMMDWDEDVKEGYKEVDIYFNCVASAGYEAQQLINYGSCVLTVLDRLEALGVRVNLFTCYAIKPHGRDSMITVKIKDAKESLNIAVCAFALAHPSMLRRMFFKAVEILEGFHQSGYGPIAEFSRERLSSNENVIRFQTINNVDSKFKTKDDVSKYLLGLLPELLNELEIETEITFGNWE